MGNDKGKNRWDILGGDSNKLFGKVPSDADMDEAYDNAMEERPKPSKSRWGKLIDTNPKLGAVHSKAIAIGTVALLAAAGVGVALTHMMEPGGNHAPDPQEAYNTVQDVISASSQNASQIEEQAAEKGIDTTAFEHKIGTQAQFSSTLQGGFINTGIIVDKAYGNVYGMAFSSSDGIGSKSVAELQKLFPNNNLSTVNKADLQWNIDYMYSYLMTWVNNAGSNQELADRNQTAINDIVNYIYNEEKSGYFNTELYFWNINEANGFNNTTNQ